MTFKRMLAVLVGLVFLGVAAFATLIIAMSSNLPQLITVQDYDPLLVSEVYDRNGEKIGEFFREKRLLLPYAKIPQKLVQAFVSAEDSSFFHHSGINFIAIARAAFANLRAGRKVQGGSTITQQVARSLLLSSEKTYTRKIKEAILAYRMESNLTKEDILYLYLNQIYLGQGAYGVGAAAEVYFRKPVEEISVSEAALLAGLPQAPSRYSPISNPSSAKERQRYVLKRMAEEGYITSTEADAFIAEPVKVFVKVNYKEVAPHYLETVRQLLVQKLGEVNVLDKGLRIETGLDVKHQIAAQEKVKSGLRELDKRQGYRGPLKKLETPEAIAAFLLESRNRYSDLESPVRTILPDGTIADLGPLNLSGKDSKGRALPNLPKYLHRDQIVEAVVTKVDDALGLVSVRFAESKGLIDIEGMSWARSPTPDDRNESIEIKKPSQVLAKGDVILVRLNDPEFFPGRIEREDKDLKRKLKGKYVAPKDWPDFKSHVEVSLEQEPEVEGSLISIDQKTEEVLAMVGGYDFTRSEFNRAIQAARQTGSAFKALVYAAALDKGYSPATLILDAPIVYEEESDEGQKADEIITKKWKPMNHSNEFTGEILFRSALIRSLNIPTVKIIEDIGVDWVAKYARRLGVFSPLNMDFTLALGSSGLTLYEMTKLFAHFGRMGSRVRPKLVHKVTSQKGEVLLEGATLDERFTNEIEKYEAENEVIRTKYLKEAGSSNAGNEPVDPKAQKIPPLFFEDPDQLMRPSTAYLITSILQGVIEEPGGTGGAARAIGRPAAGKTGSTNGYFDAWFVGYTPNVVSGVWVGYDQERSLGRGEVGGRSALPIWLEYMKFAHQKLPVRTFPIPEGIVFANIDAKTGKLASPTSKTVIRQGFVEGTEPQEVSGEETSTDSKDFYKEDSSE